MNEKHLYITDMDGTLLNSSKELSGFTKDTLNGLIAKGLNFTVASARSPATAIKILSVLDIAVPVVLMNGVIIYDIRRSKYIKIEYIPVKAAEGIINTLEENGITGFMYAVRDDRQLTYYENLDSPAMRHFHDDGIRRYSKSFEQVDRFSKKVIENEIIYFTLLDEYDRLSVVMDGLKAYPEVDAVLYRDVYSEKLWFLEIYNKAASKRNAVNFLREYCGYTKITGFGDNLNDIPLFEACDEAYAVANAMEELKEVATGVIGDNNSDAVARFISETFKR